MITNWFDKKENSRDTWNRRPDHGARVYLAAAPAFAWIAFSPLCQPHRRCIPRCEFSCALTSFDFVFHQLRRPTLCKHGTRRAHRLIVNLVLEVFFRCSSKTAKKRTHHYDKNSLPSSPLTLVLEMAVLFVRSTTRTSYESARVGALHSTRIFDVPKLSTSTRDGADT